MIQEGWVKMVKREGFPRAGWGGRKRYSCGCAQVGDWDPESYSTGSLNSMEKQGKETKDILWPS